MISSFASAQKDISKFILKNKIHKIFILSGKKSYFKSGARRFIDSIFNKKDISIFLKESDFPEIKELKIIIEKINKFKPDLVIAIGGGSVIDYAKIANVFNFSDDLKKSIISPNFKTKKKNSRLIAIPTTAGSGAEVTPSAVIYLNKIKYSVEHNLIKPDFYFLIPDLIHGSSKKLKSSSGFDAISQSIESIISTRSNMKSLAYAKKSLEYSLKYFIPSLEKNSFENTSRMCIAANLSGSAISISKTTAPHALSYPFTSIFGINHGHAVSLTLEKFLKFNYENMKFSKSNFNLKKRYELIFKLTKTKNIYDLVNYIKKIKKQANLNDNLDELGIDLKKDYSKIISGVNLLRLKNNPVLIKKTDLKSILFKA